MRCNRECCMLSITDPATARIERDGAGNVVPRTRPEPWSTSVVVGAGVVVSCGVVFSTLIWRTAVTLNRLDDERRHATQERGRLLAQSTRERATLAAVMESMSDGLMVLDSSLRLAYCNPQAAELVAGILGEDR